MLSHARARRISFKPQSLAVVAATALTALAAAPGVRAATPGTLDPSFGSGGIALTGTNTRLFATALESNGKVVAVGESDAGSTAQLLVARFNPSGSLDGSFGSGGIAHGPAISGAGGSLGRAIAVQPDGKVVVVGEATDASGAYPQGLVVERYTASGGIDTGFASGGVLDALTGTFAGSGYGVAIQPDGKIIATGTADAAGSGGVAPRVAVLRLTTGGGLDPSFSGGGVDVIDLGAYSQAEAVALQPDGRIVIAGSQAPGGQVPNALLARLNANGTLDTSFASGGAYTHQYSPGAANSAFNAVAVESSGKIVAGGATAAGNSGADAILTRFSSSGAPDGSFGSGGVVYTPSATNFTPTGTGIPGANGLALAPNGDVILAGTYVNGAATYATLWAFNAAGAADQSFGSHGAAVLTNSANSNTEYAGIAYDALTGGFVAAGDAGQLGTPFVGIAARYVGYAVTPPPPPAFRFAVAGISRSYKDATVAKHGLKLTAACNEACSIAVTLTISKGAARTLHLKSTKLASGKAALKAQGAVTITLKLSKAEIKALEKHKSVGATLTVAGTSAATHKGQTVRKTVSFKR